MHTRTIQGSQKVLSDLTGQVHVLAQGKQNLSATCPKGKLEFNLFFFAWAQTVELDHMELLATCI